MAQEPFSFRLEGLEELDRMLQQLPKAMGKTALRNALKKAAVPVRDAAKDGAPHGPTGDLGDSIEISGRLTKNQRRGRRRQKDVVEIFVGSTDNKAHLVEWGTAERFRKGSGGATGKMPAEPFMTRAWVRTRRKALKIITEELAKELVKAAARLRKRAVKGTLSKRVERELL